MTISLLKYASDSTHPLIGVVRLYITSHALHLQQENTPHDVTQDLLWDLKYLSLQTSITSRCCIWSLISISISTSLVPSHLHTHTHREGGREGGREILTELAQLHVNGYYIPLVTFHVCIHHECTGFIRYQRRWGKGRGNRSVVHLIGVS